MIHWTLDVSVDLNSDNQSTLFLVVMCPCHIFMHRKSLLNCCDMLYVTAGTWKRRSGRRPLLGEIESYVT
jgi:hypothetical protein